MRSFRFAYFAVVVFALWAAHANLANAAVTCHKSGSITTLCEWTSPWGTDVAIRLSVGQDQNNQLRWVAGRIDNPSVTQSGTMDPSPDWNFRGSSQNDVMVEVPRSSAGWAVSHSGFTLRGGFSMTRGITFSGMGGSDLIVGGDFTRNIFTGGVAVIHPNQTSWTVNRYVRVNNGSWAIVGAELFPGNTKMQISLGSQPTHTMTKFLCNLASRPVFRMEVIVGTDRKWGPSENNTPADDPAVGANCAALYKSAVQQVFNTIAR